VNLDVLQKEWAWVEEDFNILHCAQGFIKMSNLYTFIAENFYDCLRRRLTFTADLCRHSYQELWDQRQIYKHRFLKLSESLVERKLKLFEHGDIEQWGIKDQAFLEEHRDHLLNDFEFAAPYMLHMESEDAIRYQQIYMFFTNQLYDQVPREQKD